MDRWWLGDAVVLALAGGLYWMAFGTADAATAAPVKLPFLHPLFSDHLVLQRDREVPVWGWTNPGAKVTVTIEDKSATATAGHDGRWEARLGMFPAGGPHVMAVSGPKSATVSDVMFGDVWICSGQSNMQMGIGEALNAKQEIAAANHPGIRLFSVPMRIATAPESTLAAHWDVCTPATVSYAGWGGFSAAAYFFGRFLHQELKVPIGLIHTSWGGTVAEAWVSRGSLAALPDFAKDLEGFDRNVALARKGDAPFDKKLAAWWTKNDPGTAAKPGWETPATDDAAWKDMTLPAKWEEAGLPDFDGVVWFRRKVVLPATWAGKDLTLRLGKIDDRDVTWVNGVKVGGLDQWDLDRTYAVPGSAVRAGGNVLAVHVLDTGGAGGLYGPAEDMWIGLADPSSASGPAEAAGRVILTGPWKYRATADLHQTPMPQKVGDNPNVVTVLSNGMIEPLAPFAVKGAIWYQGESNAGRAEQYARLLPALIRDWRARFKSGEFPFLIVSLANWQKAPVEPPAQDPWAELREAQAFTAARVPHAGLAVAIDIGDAEDIHPKNKQEVGRRLGLSALHEAYGKDGEWSGPVYRSMTATGGAARLAFNHAAGLKTSDGGPLKGFAVAGADGLFVWAVAKIEGETVVVSAPGIAAPAQVRYAWAANPLCNLVNGAGLPAVPFRTDAPAQ